MKRVLLLFCISGIMSISGANTPCTSCDVDSATLSAYDTIFPVDTLEAMKDRAVHKAIQKQLRTVDSLRVLRDSLALEYRHLLREMKKKSSLAALMNGRQQTAAPYALNGTITGTRTAQ